MIALPLLDLAPALASVEVSAAASCGKTFMSHQQSSLHDDGTFYDMTDIKKRMELDDRKA